MSLKELGNGNGGGGERWKKLGGDSYDMSNRIVQYKKQIKGEDCRGVFIKVLCGEGERV